MMYLQNCGLLICKGQQHSLQESLQERIALMNSSKPIENNQSTMLKNSHRNSHTKQVFSFKLNQFRNYDDSDKVRQNMHKNIGNQKKLQTKKIQYFRSSEKISLKISCIQPSRQNKIQCLYTPQSLKPSNGFCKNQQNEAKATKIIKQSPLIRSDQPKITFKLTNNVYYDQKVSLNKHCKDQQISSKISEWNNQLNKIKVIDSNNFGQTSQSISSVLLQKQQKCASSNQIPSLISNNSIHTYKVHDFQNPTFKQIQNYEPIKFFENIKTLKTIQTTSQFRQNSFSRQNSTQNFSNQPFQEDEDEEQEFRDQNKIKSQKKFMKKKKKTAFFGYIQKENMKQNQNYCLEQKSIKERSIENQSEDQEKGQKKKKKVNFLFQSHLNDNSEAESASFIKLQQNQPRLKSKCSPSLHSIVQYAALNSVQVKQTPINSIKQMIFHRSPQQSSPKFKNVNTIKSIGGDSLYSQNSYLDLKFMQSIQSRRALFKLV